MGGSSNKGGQSQVTESSSGGSSSSYATQTPYQQQYYDQLLGQANNLYQQGLPEYYQGATVANFTPAQMQSMDMTQNYITGDAQNMMQGVNKNFQQMMSGQVQTGEGTPYGDMISEYTRQATDAGNLAMQGLRSQGASVGQDGVGSRQDMLSNEVKRQVAQDISGNTANMFNNAYNQAQQTQAQALGQYGNIMNMPINMSKALYNNVGLPQQQLNQAIMNDAKQRYDYNAMRPWQNLAQYANFIGGNMGGTSTQTSEQGGSSTSTTRLI